MISIRTGQRSGVLEVLGGGGSAGRDFRSREVVTESTRIGERQAVNAVRSTMIGVSIDAPELIVLAGAGSC